MDLKNIAYKTMMRVSGSVYNNLLRHSPKYLRKLGKAEIIMKNSHERALYALGTMHATFQHHSKKFEKKPESFFAKREASMKRIYDFYLGQQKINLETWASWMGICNTNLLALIPENWVDYQFEKYCGDESIRFMEEINPRNFKLAGF